MAAVATAQTLPQPIIECIAHWLFPKSRGLAKYPLGYYRRTKSLVPFLGVCCAWRQTFVQLFYHTVVLKVPMLGRPCLSQDHLPTLEDAVDRGYGPCVREIVIRLYSIHYNFDGTEQTLNPLRVVQSCGQLPSVRGLIFCVDPAPGAHFEAHVMGYNTRRRPVPNVEPCEPGRIADLFCGVVDSVVERMPNIRDVAVYGSDDNSHINQADSYSNDEEIDDDAHTGPAVVIHALQRIYDKAFSTISARVTHVAFNNEEAAEHLSFCPQIDSLTSITTHNIGQANRVSELIQRNSGSLVRLDIDGAYDLDITLLLSSRINPGETCVYPRLKELYAREIAWISHVMPLELLVNPFPALEVLHCSIITQDVALLVLRENRAHLREITVSDSVVSEVLHDNWAAEEGTFPSLTKLTLSWLDSEGLLDIYELLRHCPNLSVLNAHTRIAAGLCPVPHNPPSKLQLLELRSAEYTVGEAAAIICACPWLTNASITIHRSRGIKNRQHSDKDIQAILEKYRGHGLHLHSLQLQARGYPHTGLVCEDAVLLAALFPAIGRVDMMMNTEGQGFDNIGYIQELRTRLPYKDIVHLKGVNFSVSF